MRSCSSRGMPMPVSATVNSTSSSTQRDGQPHRALRGELQRVGQQVAQHLGEQHLVGAQPRHRRLLDHEVHLGPGGQRPQGAAQLAEDGPQVDVGEVRLDPAGLRLGQVEQVVDQRQQVGRGAADQLDLAALVVGELVRGLIGEQPPEADDRGDRRAQLMADVGQEPALRLAGRPQLHRLLVQLGVERDHAAVGLLQLVGELVVERHHAAVGLLQLAVEPGQVVALGRAPRRGRR